MDERKKVLQVKDLQTTFFTDSGKIPAVDHIDFHVREGEVLGIVGESGCREKCNFTFGYGACPKSSGENYRRRNTF